MEFSKRKWGWYLTLFSDERRKIKLLYFKKRGELSLQRHFKRSEKWHFLFGSGTFILNGYSISRPSVAHVGIGSWHQYKANSPTLVLEVQYGICEESDIERRAA